MGASFLLSALWEMPIFGFVVFGDTHLPDQTTEELNFVIHMYINGLFHQRSLLAMELHLSRTNLSICYQSQMIRQEFRSNIVDMENISISGDI